MDNYKVGDIMMRNGGNAIYIITFANANIICGINSKGFSFEIDNTNELDAFWRKVGFDSRVKDILDSSVKEE